MTTATREGLLMKAVEVSEPGGPEVLNLVDRARPVPGSAEILIKVAAAGVNGHDLRHRANGKHAVYDGETDLPGLEISGVVAEVGDGADDWAIGDKVVALVRGGAYAEYCLADAGATLPLPDGLDWFEGASLPEAYFTAWSNLVVEAKLQAGETVLIHGGGSGIGVAAIQIAVALGATVFTTAGSEAKCEGCRDLGAAVAINYREEAFEDVVLTATQGKGVDVVLDMIAGTYTRRNIECMATGGRLVVIAAALGVRPELPLDLVIPKQISIIGTLLRDRPSSYKRTVRDQVLARMWPLLAEGKARPVVDSVHPLARAGDAHVRMESSQHFGKIILSTT